MIGRLNKSALSVALPAFLICGLSGCFSPPPIALEEYVHPKVFNRNIDERSSISISIGKTTRKNILMTFGEPDFVEDFERSFIYEQFSTEGKYVWAYVYRERAAGNVTSEGMRLTIKFDQQGVVRDYSFERFKRQIPL